MKRSTTQGSRLFDEISLSLNYNFTMRYKKDNSDALKAPD